MAKATFVNLPLTDVVRATAFYDAAVAAGGCELHDPEDIGFMYSRAFEDPDGHGWGPFHMDMAAAQGAMAEAQA